jgi:hypothetical protein
MKLNALPVLLFLLYGTAASAAEGDYQIIPFPAQNGTGPTQRHSATVFNLKTYDIYSCTAVLNYSYPPKMPDIRCGKGKWEIGPAGLEGPLVPTPLSVAPIATYPGFWRMSAGNLIAFCGARSFDLMQALPWVCGQTELQ